MTRAQPLLPMLGILLGGGAATLLAVAASFDPLFVTGGTEPAAIAGPSLGRIATGAVALALLALATLRRGRRRIAFLLLWAAFLLFATHRIVERTNGAVADRWFGVAVQSLPAHPSGEPPQARCAIGTWAARCAGEDGVTFISPSPLPLAQLSPGLWDG